MNLEFWGQIGYVGVDEPSLEQLEETVSGIGDTIRYIALLIDDGGSMHLYHDETRTRYKLRYFRRGDPGPFRRPQCAIEPVETRTVSDLAEDKILFIQPNGEGDWIPPQLTVSQELAIKIAGYIVTHKVPPDWAEWEEC